MSDRSLTTSASSTDARETTGGEEGLARFEKQRHAHIAVALAQRDGTLQQEPCELCGAAETVAHHDDYDRPLDVRWLCRSHHTLVHNALNSGRDREADGHYSVPSSMQMTARKFRDGMAVIDRPVMVVRLVDGEYVRLGFWIPARAIDGGNL